MGCSCRLNMVESGEVCLLGTVRGTFTTLGFYQTPPSNRMRRLRRERVPSTKTKHLTVLAYTGRSWQRSHVFFVDDNLTKWLSYI